MKSHYEIAGDHVIWEKLGTHIVIAELKTGKYCNIANLSGMQIWELLLTGYSLTEINEIFSKHYANYESESIKLTKKFIEKLTNLNLIMETYSPFLPPLNEFKFEYSHSMFEDPALIVYDDLNTLLLLDPVETL